MKAELRYLGAGLKFEGTTESKLTQKMDDVTGDVTPIGPTPLELLLQALAGCSGMDVVMILNKMRRTIIDLHISVDADRRDEYPRIFTAIRLHFQLTSPDATKTELERAVILSQDKYCSVAGMLRPTVMISHSTELKRPEDRVA
jgi:putative redox protein